MFKKQREAKIKELKAKYKNNINKQKNYIYTRSSK